ncbi:GGDEF domain-containing protein [Paraglaciecola aquimarina]|uniref:GGDEF domain-containing protein n=1 Tax=Paraglaciecola algarum TaxID=3050085 RepID=A0ABS9D4Z5_9ALTE|nr:GGDEF domain-containing protein [Paraglaciecola sp. G1-23]MCF2946766.1 GGDEF domain-containing protein [Paraglaciecola sp. G1-23]
MKLYILHIFKIVGLLVFASLANANDAVDFLKQENVRTYDCPDDKAIPQLENFLNDPNIDENIRIDLQVFKAHWLICVGKNTPAKALLNSIVEQGVIDKTSRSYASLTYQLGFILDVNSDPARCQYYRKSENLAKGKFSDIHLSSQLGLMTVCDTEKQDIGIKLGRMFSLVKKYSETKDIASLAHIHNNIGLLYSSIGQMGLAAEQYEKSYRLGLGVYEAKNSLAPIISVISAYTGSGDFDKAAEMIEELRQGNLKVNTPLTNNWYHYAQSRHNYRIGDYEAMRKSMASWQVFLQQISNQTLLKLYNWYKAALCLEDKNKQCVQKFLTDLDNQDSSYPSRITKHIHFISFLVKAHLFLGDIEAAQKSFEIYADTVSKKEKAQQDSAKVLGVANLHNEIFSLEENLITAEQKRVQSIVAILALIGFVIALTYLTVGRSYLKSLTTDKLTGLQNEQAVLSNIKRVKTPVKGKVNALAIFDVTNFTEVNSQFGDAAGEALLIKVAKCLTDVTRDQDIVGRIRADQFIVCLKSVEERTANDFFQRILGALTRLAVNQGRGNTVNIQSSMHIYSTEGRFSDLDDVLTEIRDMLRRNKGA